MSAELSIAGVSIQYGHGRNTFTAVRDVNLKLPHGTVLGVLGESGSGKSTLARAVVGLVPTSAGKISLNGQQLTSRKSRRSIQMVFQDPYSSLDPRRTIGQSVADGLKVNENPRFSVPQLLDLVGLSADRATAYPSDFSGGQRQRIALARALAAGPEVLIADEITSALDVSVQGSVLNLLLDLKSELGFSVLFISHDLPVVRYVSDDIAVLYRGDLVEHGRADDVLLRPQHSYTRELLASYEELAGFSRDYRRLGEQR